MADPPDLMSGDGCQWSSKVSIRTHDSLPIIAYNLTVMYGHDFELHSATAISTESNKAGLSLEADTSANCAVLVPCKLVPHLFIVPT